MDPNRIQWIKAQLVKTFGKLKSANELTAGEKIGIDLNRDGKVEDWEKFGDLDGNGQIDVKDFERYYLGDKRRKVAIEKRSCFFRAAASFKYGGFRADNPIHTHMSALSSSAKPAWTEKAYAFLSGVLAYAVPRMGTMSNGQKLTWLLEVLGRRGVRYGAAGGDSIAKGLGAGGKKTLDCDTYGSAVAGMAHQLGIVTWNVAAPKHGFIRFKEKDGSIRNFDIWGRVSAAQRKIGWVRSSSYSDAIYKKMLKIKRYQIRSGIYLRSKTPAGMRSDAHSNAARELLKQNTPKGAVREAERAIELDPKNIFAYAVIIMAYEKMGNDEAVLIFCKKALRVDPKAAWVHSNLGDVYRRSSYPNKAVLAEGAYRKALRCDPRNSYANFCLGLIHLEKKQYRAAIGYLRRACAYARKKEDRDFYYLAEAYAGAGDLKRAHWAISRAIRLKPKEADHYRLRASIRLEIGWLVFAEADRKKYQALRRTR